MKNRFIQSTFESLESRTLFSYSPNAILPNVSRTPAVEATAVVNGTGLTGEYFIGDNFQTPVVVRTDARVNFDYASGRPDQDIPKGVFTTRWTGQIIPATTDTYTFYTNANSGTQLIVNGTTLIDNFSSRTSSVQQGTIALTAGQSYSIQVEYVSRGTGAAKMQLLWSTASLKKQVVPKTALFPDTTVALPSEPLLGTYYLGSDFQTPVMTRADTKIRFNWGTGSPDPTIPYNTPFSVKWTGNITAPTSGEYRFESITDDGVRLFVNGTEIINDFHVHSAQADYGKIALQAGQSYAVTMEYFQDGVGHTSAKLLWAVPGSKGKQVFVPFSPALNAPTNVMATGTSTTQIHVTWDDVANEAGFIVLRSSDGGMTYTQAGTTTTGVTSFDDTGLTPGTSYQYEVVAVGTTNSAPSSPATGTTLVGPTAVVASATVSGDTGTITWTTSPTATSYLVEKSLSATTGWTTLTTTSSTSTTDTGLAGATTYYYRVTAINALGSSAVSNVVSILTVPDAPLNLTAATVSESEVNLNWNDVAGETGFSIYESTSATGARTLISTVPAGTTTLLVGGLNPATTYYFGVEATDATGNSVISNIANATTNAAPPSYAGLTTIYGLTTNATVYSIDTTNGATAQIGTLSFGTNAGGRDPVSGDFYYVSTGSSTVAISAWDPTDDQNHVITSSVAVGYSVAQAAFRDDGQFFLATGLGDLYAINSTTGAGTLKGNIHVGGSTLMLNSGDMAFAPDGTLFLETNSELYSVTSAAINGGTGSGSIITATDIGATGTGNLQIAFGQNGILFGTDSGGQLYTVNTTSGAGTAVGSPSGVDINDLASAPIYADLSVNQSALLVQSSDSSLNNGNSYYSVAINNAGPDATKGPITVVDTLPAGLTFISGTGTGWSFIQSGQTVTMTYTGSIASGASSSTITLNVAVASTAASPVTNTVTVSATVFDTNNANNISTLSTAIRS